MNEEVKGNIWFWVLAVVAVLAICIIGACLAMFAITVIFNPDVATAPMALAS